MHFHRSVKRSYGLRFVAEELYLIVSEDLCCFLSHRGFTLNEDPVIAVSISGCIFCPVHYLIRIFCGNVTIVRCDIAISDEPVDIDLINSPAFVDKMERRIDMGAVVRTHIEGCQIADLALADAQHDLSLGRRISGIDCAAEYFL